MSRSARMWLIVLVAIVALFHLPSVAMAVDCAFEDKNDDGIFNAGDVIVPDSAWLNLNAPYSTLFPFVVPVTCNKTLTTVLASQGISVTAAKITLLANLEYLPPGGKGVVFISEGDLKVGDGTNPVLIKAGGLNSLPANSVAVAQKSVALVSNNGKCTFSKATIEGTANIQNTKVGIRCNDDITFVGSTVKGSKVNIQSLNGAILASGSNAPGGLSLANLCDNPATNLTGNGNNSGTIDAADFPCLLNVPGPVAFNSALELAAACVNIVTPPGLVNKFQAFNDPLIMIAGAGAGNDLDVRGASIVGRYRVTLATEDGDILAQDSKIDHGEQLGLVPPGGAKTFLLANAVTINRTQVDREDFTGPFTGIINIQDACLRSQNEIVVGGTVTGTPDPPPCSQFPADYVAAPNSLNF